MSRVIPLAALGAFLLLLAATPLVRAQTDKSKLDRVYYMDPATKKEADVYGKIEDESPGGIKLKVREGKEDKVKTIPAELITRVYYFTPDVAALEFNSGAVNEANWEKASGKKKQELFGTAIEKYTAVERLLTGRSEARRYIQYRIAMLNARAAKETAGKSDEAIRLLKDFSATNRSGWQIVPVLTTLAKMLEDAGRADEGREAYEALASLSGVQPALIRHAQLSVGKLSLRAGKYADAQKHLEKLAAGLSGTDQEKPFVDAYLAESKVGQGKLDGTDVVLNDLLKTSADARLRGLVHNVLADYSEKKGQAEDAFWHYLRVDALYSEDPEVHARALFRLAELYDKVKKDPIRAGDCARRLMSPTFAGTHYQKLGKAAGYKGDEMPTDKN